MIKYSARMNKDIANAVLENASSNAKYTSSDIQKELLNIISKECGKRFVKKLEMQNFVFLFMKHKINLKKNKLLLF